MKNGFVDHNQQKSQCNFVVKFFPYTEKNLLEILYNNKACSDLFYIQVNISRNNRFLQHEMMLCEKEEILFNWITYHKTS